MSNELRAGADANLNARLARSLPGRLRDECACMKQSASQSVSPCSVLIIERMDSRRMDSRRMD